MDKYIGSLCRQSLVFALAMTLALAVGPFLFLPDANFLGKDISQLAAGVISYYPWAAVFEAGRIVGVAFGLSFLAGLVAAAGALQVGTRRWVIFPLAPITAYGFWLVGTALKYPALFSGNLPSATQRLLFLSSFGLQPAMFFLAAGACLTIPVALCAARWLRHPRPYRRLIWLLPCALVMLGTALFSSEPKGHARPKDYNVLFIGVDSLRYDRLKRPEVTPALQSLLSDPQAVLCADHFVGVPRTFPSWVELVQGKYAARTGIRHMFPGFAEREKPFSGWVSALRDAGYDTAVWSDFAGDIFPRFDAGFNEVHAPKLDLTTLIRQSLDQAFVAFLPFMTTTPLRRWFPALKESPAFGDAEHLGLAFRERLRTEGNDRPWLRTIFFSTAHFPYAAPHPYYSMFADKNYRGPFYFEKNPDLGADAAGADEAEVKQVRALYDGAVRSIDDELGRLFAELRANNAWDSTLIIVTADHGEDLFEDKHIQGHGEHLRGDNVLKVPLIIKLPLGLKPQLRTVDFTTRSIDVAATVLGATQVGAAVEGSTNLLPWILGERTEPPRQLAYAETGLWFSRGGDQYFQQHRLDYPGISGVLALDQGYSGEMVLNPLYNKIVVAAKHRTLIDGDYKIIYMPTPSGVRYELYNRRIDPDNRDDLAAKDAVHFSVLRTELLGFINAQEPTADLIDDFVVPR